MSLARFFKRLGRYDRRYFRHKAYDSPLRNMIEARIDSGGLRKVYPDLRNTFDIRRGEFRQRLLPFYEEYIHGVSNEIMAVSLELSTFLLFFCEYSRPRRILDLGSGFSSFVFRLHMSEANPKPEVWSVDDSAEWLEKTRGFLINRRVPADNLATWDDWIDRAGGGFDLVLYDMGGFDFRKQSFERVLGLVGENGTVILDDMHSADYGLHVRRLLRERNLAFFNLRHYTHDKYGRYSLLIHR